MITKYELKNIVSVSLPRCNIEHMRFLDILFNFSTIIDATQFIFFVLNIIKKYFSRCTFHEFPSINRIFSLWEVIRTSQNGRSLDLIDVSYEHQLLAIVLES